VVDYYGLACRLLTPHGFLMRPLLNGGTLGGRQGETKLPMAVLQSAHVLAVPDLKRSGDFYSRVLGFEVHEMGDPGWRLFVNGPCRIMAGECPDAMPAERLGDHSYVAYLTVNDVDAYHQQASAAGAELVKSLRDEPWGMREFGLRTVDGHRIMVGQRLR